ncbi:hypothetical protein LshimejAT787_3500090 [Lyophyllum shimeji]|uniref:Uncharacterized protein n=1 Tax=Lyophyllum shimeji TaxID=47721 RepID=A0A9P3UX85_LYOSH|nr:hypothetical protein LshimejAT787_2201020 [Lyophyllum shimeji]GLB45881.1 hypothetical protein LshimejAT787_3500090 [Lyophyllum shimeji]
MTSILDGEQPYTKEDLAGLLKPALIKLVNRQKAHWPDARFHGGSHIKKARMVEVLLDPAYKFTKPANLVSTTSHVDDAEMDPPADDQNTSGAASACTISNQDASGAISTQETGASPSATPPAESVRLMINDFRSSRPPAKSVETVPLVRIQATESARAGYWLASAKELVTQLQGTCSALRGAVRVAVPDPVDSDYRQYFAMCWVDRANLAVTRAVKPEMDNLLFVEQSGIPYAPHERKHYRAPSESEPESEIKTYDVNSKDFKPLEQARRHSKALKKRKMQRAEDEIEWLQLRASERPGYSEYTNNQGRVQQNAGVVRSWRFIASFSADYFRKTLGIQGTNKIKKKVIAKALNIGTTSLAEAENGIRLANLFGAGGSREAPEVVEVLAESDSESPGGARGLLKYLVGWEKDHEL